jgi:hypothetical protein
MVTQKYRGKGVLLKRLAAQVGDKGMAAAILKKRGDMTATGKLTKKGKKRNNMTAAERAKDRASKAEGRKPSAFKYNPKTNRATLKEY